MSDIRACFLGDSFTLGSGDDTGLGWVGRVLAAERGRGRDLTVYNLGVRGQTGAQIAERASTEVDVRIGQHGDRRGVVVSFGTNDIFLGTPQEQSVQAMRGLLRWAKAEGFAAFVVSAPPSPEPSVDAKRTALNRAFNQACVDAAVPFLDLGAVVANWWAWHEEAASGDGVHPGEMGYRPVADAFGAWNAWRDWLEGA